MRLLLKTEKCPTSPGKPGRMQQQANSIFAGVKVNCLVLFPLLISVTKQQRSSSLWEALFQLLVQGVTAPHSVFCTGLSSEPNCHLQLQGGGLTNDVQGRA